VVRAFAAATLLWPVAPLHAQSVERPVPFDSVGRLLVLTPRLVQRLQLGPPEWTITGDFDDARLFLVNDTAYVLVVRRGESVERYALTADARAALLARVSTAAVAAGMPAQDAEVDDANPDRARREFGAGQIALGILAYGPGLALVTNQPTLYFAGVAAGFFATQALSSNDRLTPAMATMANDFGFRGWYLSLLLMRGSLWSSDLTASRLGTATLLGSVGGTVIGYNLGRSFTSAEAEAAGWGSTTLAVAVSGYASAAGASRADLATAAALVLGVPLGVQYPRNVSYVLTGGDLVATRVPQGLAGLAGAAIASATKMSDRASMALATTMYLGGVILGDRLIAKPFDYSTSQATVLASGTVLGALALGSAVGSSDGSNETASLAAATLGGLLGAVATHSSLHVRRGRTQGKSAVRPTTPPPSSRSARVEFAPTGLLAAATRAPGRHPILSISF
jgi:hypothetical protein